MASEMQADLEAVLMGCSMIERGLAETRTFANQALRDLLRPNPLPAQTLTEDQIVAALKADPAMAGRVIVEVAQVLQPGRQEIGRSASDRLGAGASTAARCLQSLAVALAAASYRG